MICEKGGVDVQKLIINGGSVLKGEINLQGAKNSSLPILAGTFLADGESVINNCPKLSDIYSACRILTHLGCRCSTAGNTVTVSGGNYGISSIPDELMREMRSSIVFLGAVLGRYGRCSLSLPGGCELGPRPVDMHLSSLRRMGVTICEKYGMIECRAENGLKGAKISLQFPSVGATENIILAGVTANGVTEIHNAAREPEITDLADYLIKCGAKIKGAGESTIIIEGVKKLKGCEYEVMPDRIAAATYIAAAAASGGEIKINKIRYSDVDSFTNIFEQMGCRIYSYKDMMYVKAPESIKSVKNIRTMPYPGFPTDAQAVVMAVLCKADGTSIFEENIFESRYKHVDGLLRMGADIKVSGKTAIVEGRKKLYGTRVSATDLRGGAAMVIAGLSAEGITEISDISHIDRGYEAIENVLSALGAEIKRSD